MIVYVVGHRPVESLLGAGTLTAGLLVYAISLRDWG